MYVCVFVCPGVCRWSPDVTWSCDEVVQWNSDFFKAEGPQNVAIPSNSSQELFYVSVWVIWSLCEREGNLEFM